MVDPDKEGGSAEPHQNAARQADDGNYKHLRQAGGLISQVLGWPRRWWRGGDHNRRTANATVLLTLGTLVLAAVNLGMLLEMRRGGNQQHTDTIAVLGKTDATIAAMNAQAGIMRGQLDEMKAAQRPWLYIDDVKPITPLILIKDGGIFTIQYSLRNVGHSIANRAIIYAQFFPIWYSSSPGTPMGSTGRDQITSPGKSIRPLTVFDDYETNSRTHCNTIFDLRDTFAVPLYTTMKAVFPSDKIVGEYIISPGKQPGGEVPDTGKSYRGMLTICIMYEWGRGDRYITRHLFEIDGVNSNGVQDGPLTLDPGLSIAPEKLYMLEITRYAD